MIQQKSKLWRGAMKLAPWPAVSFGALWPGRMNGHIPTLPTFFWTSTLAQAQKSSKDESEKKISSKEDEEAHSGKSKKSTGTTQDAEVNSNSSHSVTTAQDKKVQEQIRQLKNFGDSQKDLAAVMRVKSLTEALEVCSGFNPRQRLAALKNLALDQSRPMPLIQELAKELPKSVEDFNVKELADILFCLSKLSYTDEALLSKTCEVFRTHMKTLTNAAIVGSSITSVRKLQWKDPELLNDFSVWVLKNFKKFQDPCSMIYTLALQNHSNETLDELIPLVWKDVSRDMSKTTNIVNFLWSLLILKSKASKEILAGNIQNIFKPQFIERIGSYPYTIPLWKKLSNIHAASKNLLSKELRFTIPESVNDQLDFSLRNDKVIMISEVKEFLFKDMGTDLYSTCVPTHMGFVIDLICNLDDQMRAIPVEVNAPSCTRIAVMMHSFHECCQPSKEPNGVRILEMDLLKNHFQIVSVPYDIVAGGHTKVHGYFESALRNAIQRKS